jgi:small subunit ribosomal protein S2
VVRNDCLTQKATVETLKGLSMSERTITIDLKALAQAGVIFGHKASRWNPRMAPYIWGQKNGIHLIDVSKTGAQLRKAAQFLESIAAQGETILWVGTKKAARDIIIEAGRQLNQPYVKTRWIGGTLTNFSQVKKSVTKLLHYEDILKKAEQFTYTKKEFVVFKKIADRLDDNVGSIKDLSWPIGAIVLVDIKKEDTALREAVAMNIPVVALVDTNCDPSLVDYVIPTNDDAPKAIKIIIETLVQAVQEGKKASGVKKHVKQEVIKPIAEESLIDPIALQIAEEDEEAVVRKARAQIDKRAKPLVNEEDPAELAEEAEKNKKKKTIAEKSAEAAKKADLPVRKKPVGK